MKSIGCLSALLILSSTNANLIANGSFELGTFVPDGNNTMSLLPGSANIQHWTVSTAELAWISTPNPFGITASEGIKSLDLMGYHDSLPSGVISQQFQTTVGHVYRVQFDVALVSQVVVSAAGQSGTFNGNASGHPVFWSRKFWEFTAIAATTDLSFRAGSGTHPIYSGLDNIVVTVSSAQIQAHVNLLDFEGSTTGLPVQFEVRELGTLNVLESRTLPLDANGDCVFVSSLPSGMYDVSAKASHWLREVISPVILNAGSTTAATWTLTNGDSDPDNEVNLVDFGIVASSFGLAVGDAGFNVMADLNGDDEVNLVDFGIVSANFGQIGDD